MSERIPIGTRSRIKWQGAFSGNDWYRKLFDLFITYGFSVEEKMYREFHSASGGSKDIMIKWTATKNPKGDKYAQFLINIDTVIVGFKKTKVVKDGQEVSMDFGDVDSFYYGYVVLDPEDKWQKSSLMRYLRYFYDRFFYRNKVEFYKNRCYEDMYTITNEIKAYFNMYRFM